MKILILGSEGFIGKHLVIFFTNKGDEVTGCDIVESSTQNYTYHKLSILSPDFDSLFINQSFDICMNASGSGNVSWSVIHPFNDFELNTVAVAKVLDTIRKYQPICKYIHISSAAVYGNPKELPVKETDTTAPLSPYGFHKLMSETLCREYYELYILPIAIIRPFSVYGNGLKKQLLWDICNKLQRNKSISLFGTGGETRDFIHISDLLELTAKIIDNSRFECDVYNAASGTETSVREVAAIFEKNFPGSEISFSGEQKKGDPANWKATISKVINLGFTPKANLGNSIADYINWYRSYGDR
ncbi:MAG: SDR family oxidoreductase [Ginsengibacter sp.]